MNLSDIRAAVLEETNRTDKSAMILRAVRSIVLQAHRIEDFQRDLVKDNAVYPASPGNDILVSLPTRWRRFERIDIVDLATGVFTGNKYSWIEPDDNNQFNPALLPNYYWVEGAQVKLTSYTAASRLAWWYYADPDLAQDTASTWITTRYSQDIIDGAIGYVYRKLGDTESARNYLQLWAEFRQRLVADNLQPQT